MVHQRRAHSLNRFAKIFFFFFKFGIFFPQLAFICTSILKYTDKNSIECDNCKGHATVNYNSCRYIAVVLDHTMCLKSSTAIRTRSRILERTISLRFRGIILRVLRFEVSVYSVYITNQFQTTFSQGGGGVESTEYIFLLEMKQGYCVCPLSWSVHCNFTGDGHCNERGWACTPHPQQPGLILPS